MNNEQQACTTKCCAGYLLDIPLFACLYFISLKSCHSPETPRQRRCGRGPRSGAGHRGEYYVVLIFCQNPRSIDKWISFTPTSLITLVDKSDCALRKRGLKGIISGKMFSPVRLGIILATMVIFRQNWSLGYDWL